MSRYFDTSEPNSTCNVCGRRFAYGDKWSPMMREDIWNHIVKYYNLREFEIEAGKRFDKAYDEWMNHKYEGADTEDEYEKLHDTNKHLFICYKCMERALGRKIQKSDLIGEDVPINQDFEEFYFKD